MGKLTQKDIPMIGLVTVLYKSNTVIEDFIKSLSRQTFKDFHLYIVDNNPYDTDYILLQKLLDIYHLPATSIIKNEKNVGVAEANNQGIRASLAAGFTHTLLLNNDIEITQETLLSEMVKFATLHNEQLLIPKILFHGSRRIWMAGGKLLVNRGTTDHVGGLQLDNGDYDQPAYFNYAPTCFMLINNSVFDKIGLMDDRYFVYYDDTDFIFRAIKSGYRIYYLPKCEVFHKVSISTGGVDSHFTIHYMTRNRLFFVRKNYNGYAFFRALFYTFFDILRVARRYYDLGRWKVTLRAMVMGMFMK